MGRSAHLLGPGGRGLPFSALMRKLSFPFWLAGARLRRRGGPLVLVVLGLAAATAMLAAVLAGTVAAQDREVGRQVAALPAKVRAVRVNWFSVGGQGEPCAPR